ncbi:hypothetical protein ACFPOD_14205 [Nitratireductor kimnyeongensis]|uniref:Uncharacterized protein n=1 Tax=Nitratireductor kimnyeongensis TaxID=430679 RepID=A0ABW0TAF9_9HYPH|nr:hypothetical protein [Nitratireductor kimnyeongensis]QZZ36560.1 hypothetical protein KW403_05350 [Nitratireductor kimnyeongensis]
MHKSAVILSMIVSMGAHEVEASEMIFHCRAFGAILEIQTESPWRAYTAAYSFLIEKGFPDHPQTLRAISCRLHRS